jgi:hypothetical protein
LPEGFAGFLQTSGYAVYQRMATSGPDIRLIGCFDHARLKLDEVLKAQGNQAKRGKSLVR